MLKFFNTNVYKVKRLSPQFSSFKQLLLYFLPVIYCVYNKHTYIDMSIFFLYKIFQVENILHTQFCILPFPLVPDFLSANNIFCIPFHSCQP